MAAYPTKLLISVINNIVIKKNQGVHFLVYTT